VKPLKHILLAIVIFIGATPITAQWTIPAALESQDGDVPSVFLIGQNETTYEKLMTDHETMLLTVCENDMNRAYGKWVDVLTQMESYSENQEFDLKGVKLWLNVFWNEDGSIQHVVYHPKPNSKNMKTEDLSNFFTAFIDVYNNDIKSVYKFSHYGSAAFPTFPQRVARD